MSTASGSMPATGWTLPRVAKMAIDQKRISECRCEPGCKSWETEFELGWINVEPDALRLHSSSWTAALMDVLLWREVSQWVCAHECEHSLTESGFFYSSSLAFWWKELRTTLILRSKHDSPTHFSHIEHCFPHEVSRPNTDFLQPCFLLFHQSPLACSFLS